MSKKPSSKKSRIADWGYLGMGKRIYRSYIIDTENTGSKWEELITKMRKSDRIVLFYTIHSTSVSMAALDEIISSKRKLELIKSGVGDNALDMAIIISIAQEIERLNNVDDSYEYIIVSDDKDYDSAIAYFNTLRENVAVSRLPLNVTTKCSTECSKTTSITTSKYTSKKETDKLSEAQKKWRIKIGAYPGVKSGDIEYCITCLSKSMNAMDVTQRRKRFYKVLDGMIKDKACLKAMYDRVRPVIRDITQFGPFI